MDKEIKEIEDIEEEIIEDEITESTLEEALEEAPMLEEENKDLKAKIAELEKMIEGLTKKEEPEETEETEEKSLEDIISELLDRKLSEVPERKGMVDPEAMEEKFKETEPSVDDMVEVIKKMSPEERGQLSKKWAENLISFAETNPSA